MPVIQKQRGARRIRNRRFGKRRSRREVSIPGGKPIDRRHRRKPDFADRAMKTPSAVSMLIIYIIH